MNDTREFILKTSLILFLQKSYRDVTMNEIVKSTGLSKGAFYHYFKSKEELFKEIVSVFFSMGTIRYEDFSQSSLKEFYHQYVNYLDQSMNQIRKMFPGSDDKSANINFFLLLFEAAARFPEVMQMELEIHNKDLQAWENVISLAKKKGEIKIHMPDHEIASLFLYCNDGVFIRFVNNDKSGVSFKELLLKAYDAIYEMLKI